MDKKFYEKVLKACDGSIKKWKKIETGKGEDQMDDNCPLCQFFRKYENDHCERSGQACPVKILSGDTQCYNTPWKKWDNHHSDKHYDIWMTAIGVKIQKGCKECKKLATKERQYIEKAKANFIKKYKDKI